MKPNAILLLDRDGDSVGFVLEAAARTGHRVQVARTTFDALQRLTTGARRVDAVIIDVDAGADELALLAEMSGCEQGPPLVLLCGVEAYLKRFDARYRAAACFCKPLSIEQLRSTFDRILRDNCRTTFIGQQIDAFHYAVGLESLRLECPTPNCESTPRECRSRSSGDGVARHQFTRISDKLENEVSIGSTN